MSSLPVDRPAWTHYTRFLLVSSIAVIVALLGIFKVLSMEHGWDAQVF